MSAILSRHRWFNSCVIFFRSPLKLSTWLRDTPRMKAAISSWWVTADVCSSFGDCRCMFQFWWLQMYVPVLVTTDLCYSFIVTLNMLNLFWKELNSLWPSDVIWRPQSVSILAQVMAHCLTSPSHYLNQYWLIIKGGNHMRAISQRVPELILCTMIMEMKLLKLLPYLPGANELPVLCICICQGIYLNIDMVQVAEIYFCRRKVLVKLTWKELDGHNMNLPTFWECNMPSQVNNCHHKVFQHFWCASNQ